MHNYWFYQISIWVLQCKSFFMNHSICHRNIGGFTVNSVGASCSCIGCHCFIDKVSLFIENSIWQYIDTLSMFSLVSYPCSLKSYLHWYIDKLSLFIEKLSLFIDKLCSLICYLDTLISNIFIDTLIPFHWLAVFIDKLIFVHWCAISAHCYFVTTPVISAEIPILICHKHSPILALTLAEP
jgi:hypothetical protein